MMAGFPSSETSTFSEGDVVPVVADWSATVGGEWVVKAGVAAGISGLKEDSTTRLLLKPTRDRCSCLGEVGAGRASTVVTVFAAGESNIDVTLIATALSLRAWRAVSVS